MSKFFAMGGREYYPAPVSDAIGLFDSIGECLCAILHIENETNEREDVREYYVIFSECGKTPYAFWGYHCDLNEHLISASKLITVDAYREGGKLEVLDNE